MNKIHWVERFSVGVEEMDRQHQQIIRMINGLIDSVAKGNEQETLPATLSEMINYALQHFKDEEQLMRDIGFVELREHVSLHRQFKEQVVRLCAANNAAESGLGEEVAQYLTSWLVNHILVEDMKYADYLQAQRAHHQRESAD